MQAAYRSRPPTGRRSAPSGRGRSSKVLSVLLLSSFRYVGSLSPSPVGRPGDTGSSCRWPTGRFCRIGSLARLIVFCCGRFGICRVGRAERSPTISFSRTWRDFAPLVPPYRSTAKRRIDVIPGLMPRAPILFSAVVGREDFLPGGISILSEFAGERPQSDAQGLGRLGAVAGETLQGGLDHPPFHFFQADADRDDPLVGLVLGGGVSGRPIRSASAAGRRRDWAAGVEHARPGDDVFQLADVARPMIFRQQVAGRVVQRAGLALQPRGGAAGEMIDQRGEVFAAVAHGGTCSGTTASRK